MLRQRVPRSVIWGAGLALIASIATGCRSNPEVKIEVEVVETTYLKNTRGESVRIRPGKGIAKLEQGSWRDGHHRVRVKLGGSEFVFNIPKNKVELLVQDGYRLHAEPKSYKGRVGLRAELRTRIESNSYHFERRNLRNCLIETRKLARYLEAEVLGEGGRTLLKINGRTPVFRTIEVVSDDARP